MSKIAYKFIKTAASWRGRAAMNPLRLTKEKSVKIVRASLLVMALACSVYAGEMQCGVASPGEIPNDVTSRAGEMPNDTTAAGEIQNDITSTGDIPYGVNGSASQVTQIVATLLTLLP
jgi:hypothetical protein